MTSVCGAGAMQLVFLTLALLINDVLAPHFVLVMAMTVVLCLNLIPAEQALAGFSNEGVLTIAVLFVVAKVASPSPSAAAPPDSTHSRAHVHVHTHGHALSRRWRSTGCCRS
jgi:membrane protein implicated in regulation of membrane protease activity